MSDTEEAPPRMNCKFLDLDDIYCVEFLPDSLLVSHLESAHKVKKFGSTPLSLKFPDIPLLEGAVHFDPIIIQLEEDGPAIGLLSLLSVDGQMSMTCFFLQNSPSERDRKNYRVKFKVAGEDTTLEWTGKVQSHLDFKDITCNSSFTLSLETQKEYFNFFKDPFFESPRAKLEVAVAVYKVSDGTPGSLDGDLESVTLLAYAAGFSSRNAFNAICDGCKAFPIQRTRYKCMQCEDYDLCRVCMERSTHPEHVFARIQDHEQEDYYHDKYVSRG